jgi:hypothetical protein
MVGEIEVVVAERAVDPVRHPNHRGTLDICPDAQMKLGGNDRLVEQSVDAHVQLLPICLISRCAEIPLIEHARAGDRKRGPLKGYLAHAGQSTTRSTKGSHRRNLVVRARLRERQVSTHRGRPAAVVAKSSFV